MCIRDSFYIIVVNQIVWVIFRAISCIGNCLARCLAFYSGSFPCLLYTSAIGYKTYKYISFIVFVMWLAIAKVARGYDKRLLKFILVRI